MNLTTVHYLFSKNKKIGSKIISLGTSNLEPEISPSPSHVALLINEKWVIESTIESGFRIIPYKTWKELNTELYKIKDSNNWTIEEVKTLYKPLKGKKYDWLGVLYFSWRIALNLAFKRPIPEINKWQSDDKYFCSEIIGKMTGTSYQMTAPIQLLKQLLK